MKNHNNLPKEYRQYSFPEFQKVEDRMSIMSLFSDSNRCGIYILYFGNGDYYVGQSVDIATRFTQHSKNHEDITQLSFILVNREKLNEVEQKLINSFEMEGIRLRNIALTSIPKGETDLQKIFSKDDQDRWLDDNNSEPTIFRKKELDEHRRKYEKKFLQLSKKPFYEELTEFLKVYFEHLVPEPYLTAMDFWRISCLPHKNKDVETLCRINIYMQEVLTVYIENGNIYYSFHLSKGEFSLNAFKKLIYLLRGIVISNHTYKSGGADQLHIDISGTKKAINFINSNRKSIKLFNLRLMNKGVGFNKLSHCVDLPNYVLPTKP